MKAFFFTFSKAFGNGPSSILANSQEEAQEILIEKLESLGIVHGDIMAIRSCPAFCIKIDGKAWHFNGVCAQSREETEEYIQDIWRNVTGENWPDKSAKIQFCCDSYSYDEWRQFHSKNEFNFFGTLAELIGPEGNLIAFFHLPQKLSNSSC